MATHFGPDDLSKIPIILRKIDALIKSNNESIIVINRIDSSIKNIDRSIHNITLTLERIDNNISKVITSVTRNLSQRHTEDNISKVINNATRDISRAIDRISLIVTSPSAVEKATGKATVFAATEFERQLYNALDKYFANATTAAKVAGVKQYTAATLESLKKSVDELKDEFRNTRRGSSYTYTDRVSSSEEGRSVTAHEAFGIWTSAVESAFANSFDRAMISFDTVLRARLDEYKDPEQYFMLTQKTLRQFQEFIQSRDLRKALQSMTYAQKTIESVQHVSKEYRGMLFEVYDVARKQLGFLGNLVFTLQSDYLFKKFYQLSLRPLIDQLKASPWFMVLEGLSKPLLNFLKDSVFAEAAMMQAGAIGAIAAPFLKLFPVHHLLSPLFTVTKAAIGAAGYTLMGDKTGYKGSPGDWLVGNLSTILKQHDKTKETIKPSDKNEPPQPPGSGGGSGGGGEGGGTTSETESSKSKSKFSITETIGKIFDKFTSRGTTNILLAVSGASLGLLAALVGKKLANIPSEASTYMSSIPGAISAFGIMGYLADMLHAAFTGESKLHVLAGGAKGILSRIAEAVKENVYEPLRKIARGGETEEDEEDKKTEKTVEKHTDKYIEKSGSKWGDKLRGLVEPVKQLAEPLSALSVAIGLGVMLVGKGAEGIAKLVTGLTSGISMILATVGEGTRRVIKGFGEAGGIIIEKMTPLALGLVDRGLSFLKDFGHGFKDLVIGLFGKSSQDADTAMNIIVSHFTELNATLAEVNNEYSNLIRVLRESQRVVRDASVNNAAESEDLITLTAELTDAVYHLVKVIKHQNDLTDDIITGVNDNKNKKKVDGFAATLNQKEKG